MRRLRPLLLAALLAPSAALADHPFILPSNTLYSAPNEVVTFDAAASEHVFFFDHRPLQLASIKVWAPDGSAATPTNTLQGRFRSVFDLKLEQQGTYKVASQQTNVGGTFMLDGVERRVGRFGPPPGAPGGPGGPGGGREREGRPDRGGMAGMPGMAGQGERGPGGPGAPDGPRRLPPVPLEEIPATATDLHLFESVNSVETFVTNGEPTTVVFKPTGKGLEFEPITHPNAIAAGETARFRFLIDGRPAAGVAVTVVPGGDRYREDTGTMALTTGADGVVAIRWPAAGMYWLGAQAEDRNPAEKKAEVRRMSYAATLEVMTP